MSLYAAVELLEGLPLLTRILWIFFLVGTIAVFDLAGFVKILYCEETLPDEHLWFRRFLLFRFVSPDMALSGSAMFREIVFRKMLYCGILYFLLPMTLIIWIAPILLLLDSGSGNIVNEFQQLYFTKLQGMLADQALGNTSFFSQFLPLVMANQFSVNGQIHLSTALGLLACIIMILFSILILFGFIIFAFKAPNSDKTLIEKCDYLLKLEKMLGMKLINEKLHKQMETLLSKNIKGWRYYFKGPDYFPMTIRTCKLYNCIHSLRIDSHKAELIQNWLKRCECKAGGFSFKPGGKFSLNHTASILDIKEQWEEEFSLSKNLHIQYLLTILQKLTVKTDKISSEHWLHQIRLCLESLHQINALNNIGSDIIIMLGSQCIQYWRRSCQKSSDTRAMLLILHLLNRQDHWIVSHLKEQWLPEKERTIVALSPEQNLEEILDCIWILHFLFPTEFRQRSSVSQVKDNLQKMCGADFSSG